MKRKKPLTPRGLSGRRAVGETGIDQTSDPDERPCAEVVVAMVAPALAPTETLEGAMLELSGWSTAFALAQVEKGTGTML